MLPTKQFSSASCYFLPLRPKYLPPYLPFLSTLNILHMFHIHASKIIIIIISTTTIIITIIIRNNPTNAHQ